MHRSVFIGGASLAALGLAALVNASCGSDATAQATASAASSTASSTASSSSSTATSSSSAAGGSTSASTGAGGDDGTGGTHAEPPPAGPMKPGDGTGSTTLAVKKLYLGLVDPDGTPDKQNGWKHFGYDIDGKNSTATTTGMCAPRSGGLPANVYPDGDDGIDNSFGKNILPIILSVDNSLESDVNQTIAGGGFTLLFDMLKLGSGADYNPIDTRFYFGSSLGMPALFDGTDVWPVTYESLTDPTDLTTPKLEFPMSYVAGNTWVSGTRGTIALVLPVGGTSVTLTIRSAVVTMQLDPAHDGAVKGVIAGVLATDEFVTELKKVAGVFDPTLCSGPIVDSITNEVEQSSDIMQDGTQDPTKVCDGISIGLGFDASLVMLGAIAPPAQPQPDPCAD